MNIFEVMLAVDSIILGVVVLNSIILIYIITK